MRNGTAFEFALNWVCLIAVCCIQTSKVLTAQAWNRSALMHGYGHCSLSHSEIGCAQNQKTEVQHMQDMKKEITL